MIDFLHKILVPQCSDYLIPRPQLNELLDAITNRCLITLSAPAGYGKTSLLTHFARTYSALPICWYTLDTLDQDPWVFVSYLAASIEQQFPGSMKQTTALLGRRDGVPFTTAVATLTRDAYTVAQDFVVIIDDWHLVDPIADVREAVAHLLLRSLYCHILLASRSYPSLPNIALLAARRQMSSLNEQHLRFSASEVAQVLSAEYDTSIPAEQVTELVEQSNGWITGILLSYQAVALPLAAAPSAAGGAERQIYHFLAEQVFNQQPPEVCGFLLDSSLLEELTPDRCQTIFGRADSRLMLERLLRHHLFVTEIKPAVLRYHPLFREFLQEHYRTNDPQRYHAMMLHVADGYAAQGQWLLAFDRYIEAGDFAAAERVAAAVGEDLYACGRLESLERWFAALPMNDLNTPLLCLKARVALDRGRDHEAQTLAVQAETQTRPEEVPLVKLLQAQLARIAGRYEYALNIAQQVLHSTQDSALRATALRTIAICHHRLGQPAEAIEELNQALLIEHQRGDLHTIAKLQIDLGICHRDIGLLEAAEQYFNQAEAYWATIGNSGLRAVCLSSKGAVQCLAGRYTDAHATLLMALQHAIEALVPDYHTAVLSNLGDLYCDLKLWERAAAAYGNARKLGSSAHLMSSLDLADVRLLVRQQQYEAAARALRQLPEMTTRRHPHEVSLLHGSIACGLGDYDQATSHVQQAIAALEQVRALMGLARAHLLRARIIAAATPSDQGALIAALDQVGQIADQLNHDAFLVAEALPTQGLLRRAAAAGWARATNWLQRQQDVLLAAQMIERNDGRAILSVRTLGVDQITLEGRPAHLGWIKAREVLYYLLAHPDGATIDVLCTALWPDLSPERGRKTLGTAIYQLRSILSRDLIALHRRQVYQIDLSAVWIDYDVERFLDLLDNRAADAEALFEALDLYHGPYLASVDTLWCLPLRTHLEQRYLQALRLAAAHYERERAYADALILYERTLAVDELDEAAHVSIMRCQIALNNRAAAISQYQTLRRTLNEELGLDPGQSSEAELLYRQILEAS